MILEQFLNYKYNWFNCKISLLLYSCSATHSRSYSHAFQDHCHYSCLLIPQEKIFFNVLCVKIALLTVFFQEVCAVAGWRICRVLCVLQKVWMWTNKASEFCWTFDVGRCLEMPDNIISNKKLPNLREGFLITSHLTLYRLGSGFA